MWMQDLPPVGAWRRAAGTADSVCSTTLASQSTESLKSLKTSQWSVPAAFLCYHSRNLNNKDPPEVSSWTLTMGPAFCQYFLLGFLLTKKPVAGCTPVSSKGNDQRHGRAPAGRGKGNNSLKGKEVLGKGCEQQHNAACSSQCFICIPWTPLQVLKWPRNISTTNIYNHVILIQFECISNDFQLPETLPLPQTAEPLCR